MFFIIYRKVCRVIKVISLDAEKKKNAALETDDSDDDVICLDDPVPGQKATPTKQKVKDEKRWDGHIFYVKSLGLSQFQRDTWRW